MFRMTSKPRLAFLIPIASSQRAKDWHLACALFKQTLLSVFNSSEKNYCVVVAGHEPPNHELPQDHRFKFLSLDHPAPSLDHGYWFAAIRDKLMKLAAAWEYAKATWNPEYVMKLDWDDLVSSRLVEWLVSAQDEAGYLIKHGWIFRSHGRRFIERTEYFDRVCGSCLIIRSDLADQSGPFVTEVEGAVLDDAASQFAAADHYSLIPGAATGTLLLNDCHQRYAAQFAYLGHRLATVPFNAAVCRLGHGNNAGIQSRTETARMFLGRLRRTRLITPGIRKEFMLG
jgi:hypothetical protein